MLRVFTAVLLSTTLLALASCGGDSDSNVPAVVPQEPVEPIVRGAVLAHALGDVAIIDMPYRSSVAVIPNDPRNSVTGLTIKNHTIGGSQPRIDSEGRVEWTPNAVDFSNTLELTITATLRDGESVDLASPVSVRRERLVHQAQLPSSGGRIADKNGRYLIKVEAEPNSAPLTGTLSISEVFSSNESFVYVIRVPKAISARITVLDAPPILNSAAQVGSSGSAVGAKIASSRASALANTLKGLTSNVGAKLDPILTGKGYVANRGEVNVYTTRDAAFQYSRSTNEEKEYWSPEATNIYQIDANCSTAVDCTSPSMSRSPVVLVHGFNLGQEVGGGEGTWGDLASALSSRGHPVFELRWNTYMRFEEAAGVLSILSKRIAELTGHQVTVVAHSFGGIVAHLSMMGRGIRHEGDAWRSVPVEGVYRGLITLGSPLSGIRSVPKETYGLTAGRDDDDISIDACEAITCFQAGSSVSWGTAEIGELTSKVAAIDSSRTGLPDDREGETVRTLHSAWQQGAGHAVPFSTVVSVKKRPYEDYSPDLTDQTAFDLGDGLISIMGQAVVPTDFSSAPYAIDKNFRIGAKLGADYLSKLDARFAVPMERIVLARGTEYFFALRAAHSCAQRAAASDCFLWTTSDAYLIANYPKGGLVDKPGINTGQAQHPLGFFIESTEHLAKPRAKYASSPQVPVSIVRGRLLLNGQTLPGQNVSFQIQDAVTGSFVTDALVGTSDQSGVLLFDAGKALADRYPGQRVILSSFNVVLRAGTGLSTSRVFISQGLATEVPLGDIDLTPTPQGALVGVTGRLIDGQTEDQRIPAAQLFFMKGLHQSTALLQEVEDTTTSRRVITDALGNFFLGGLEHGYYSVLAVKEGYVSQMQGVVYIAPGHDTVGLTFSLLRKLESNQATITLRWQANSGDTRVSPDLDSWMYKVGANGVGEWIAYFSQVGSAGERLDRDDRTFEGPETISFALDTRAQYTYWVGNYEYLRGLSTIPGSKPTVLVRIGDVTRQFSLPIGLVSDKQYWRVFSMSNGVVIPCEVDCLENGSGSSSTVPGK